MDNRIDPGKPPRGAGLFSLWIGAIALAGEVLYVAVAALIAALGGGDPGSQLEGLNMFWAWGGLAFFCGGLIANVIGLGLGIAGVRRTNAARERRQAKIGVALSLLPLLSFLVFLVRVLASG